MRDKSIITNLGFHQLRGFLSSKIKGLAGSSLLRNSLFIMATGVTTAGLGYLYWIIATHTFSEYDVGLASALISAMSLTAVLSNLGMGSMLIQLLPRAKDGREWSRILSVTLVTGAGSGLIGAFIALGLFYFTPKFSVTNGINIFSVSFLVCVPLSTLSLLIDAAFNAERSSVNTLIRNSVFSLGKIIFIAVLILLKFGAVAIFLSWVLGIAVSMLVSYYQFKRIRPDFVFRVENVINQITTTFPAMIGNHLISIWGTTSAYIFPLLVTIRLSAEENAYFYTTWMLSTMVFMISPAVATSLFAQGAYSKANIRRKITASFLMIASLLAPVIVAVFLCGQILLGIFGASYADHGILMLRLLAISSIPDAVTNIYISFLRIQGKLKEGVYLNLGMTLVTLFVAWFFLPSLGIAAVGLSWLVGQSAGSVYVLIKVIKVELSGRDVSKLYGNSEAMEDES